MADNYLERQYEQYESRKAVWLKKQSMHKTRTQPVCTDNSKQHNKRVLVTGGAQGIGQAIVKVFCKENAQVVFFDNDRIQGEKTALVTGAQFLYVDVSNTSELETSMQQLLKQWNDIDIIINNAGISLFSPLWETSSEIFDHILSTNLRPVFITARQLAIHRRSLSTPNPFGRIINICSTRFLMSEPGSEGYAASKGGIYSLTHALAASLAPLHITVNSISPGWIQNKDYDQLRMEDHKQHFSGRVGKPEDIARMCLFLCKEENDFINGENITIDGGMTRKMIYTE